MDYVREQLRQMSFEKYRVDAEKHTGKSLETVHDVVTQIDEYIPPNFFYRLLKVTCPHSVYFWAYDIRKREFRPAGEGELTKEARELLGFEGGKATRKAHNL